MQDIKKMFRDLAEYGRRWLQEWADPYEVAMHADAVAVDEEPVLEEEARERQLATLKQNTDKEIIPERSNGQARDKAGDGDSNE